MDQLSQLGQIFEATATDLRLFDATIKSLLKEFAAGALVTSSGVGSQKEGVKPSSELVGSVLQKYRQMTILFLVKLLNHLVVANNLAVPCLSCGVQQPIATVDVDDVATKATTNKILAPSLAATASDSKLNLTALNTDTMAAISPLLAAAAVLTPATSSGSGSAVPSSDNSAMLAKVQAPQVDQTVGNSAQQYALMAQQKLEKLAALVQIHQQQQDGQQTSESENGATTVNANANDDSEPDLDDEEVDAADDSNGEEESTSADDQPIDFSSANKASVKLSPVVDENRPPLLSAFHSVQPAFTNNTSVDNQQHQTQPATSAALSSVVGASSLLQPNALSDALGRVANRLPVSAPNANSLLAATGGVFNLPCPTNPSDISTAYAKFQSAIASAVTSNHRASLGAKPHLNEATPTSSASASSPFAALAQHLFPGQANNAAAATNPVAGTGLLSPAIAGLMQKATGAPLPAAGNVPVSETLPLSLTGVGPANNSTALPTAVSSSSIANNRRASLPPYMMHSEFPSQQASPVAPGSGMSASSGGGVRTADRYRVVYTSSQTFELEQEYRQNKFITITRKKELAQMLGLNERQVKIWFQNRRAKDKRAHRRGTDSATGGELINGEPKPAKMSKVAGGIAKDEAYGGDGSAASLGNLGSCSSVSSAAMNQHDMNSNSNNSYDGSMQAHRDEGEDIEADEDECDELIDDEDNEDEVAAAQQGVCHPGSSVVYPSATIHYSSGSNSSTSTAASSSVSLPSGQVKMEPAHLLAQRTVPLVLATGGSQPNMVPSMVVGGKTAAMEIN